MKSSALVRDSLSVLQRGDNGVSTRARAWSFVQANEKNKFSLHGFRFLFNPSHTSLPLADCSFCRLSDLSFSSGPRGPFDVTYDTNERVISPYRINNHIYRFQRKPIVSLNFSTTLACRTVWDAPVLRNAFACRRSLICVTIKYQHPDERLHGLTLSRLHAAKISAEGGAQK